MSMNYKVIGEGFPIVMIHGWTLDHQVMMHAMEPVFHNRDGWRRIYIDLPGMGASEPQASIQNSDDMLSAVLHFLDTLIPNQPFMVCGNSYGGYIARGITHFRRHFVRGMLLLAPLVIAEVGEKERQLPQKTVLKREPVLMSQLLPEEAAEFELMAVLQGQKEWERFRRDIFVPSRSAHVDFLNRILHNGYAFTVDVDTASGEFEHPTLILTGRQDHVVGFQDAWRLMENYPRATFATLDMAGHNLFIEQPDVFYSLVNNWVDRLET